jgi:hypothetical protein
MYVFGYHIPSLISIGAAFSSIAAAFSKFDADQSDKNREFVRLWLLGLKADDQQWAQFFKELFAKAFGERHLSAKCVGRSALLSAAILTVLWTPWVWYGVNVFDDPASARLAPLFFGPLSMIVDYFTLWKTRALLTKTRLLSNGLFAMAIVVGDVVITKVIALTILLAPLVTIALVDRDPDLVHALEQLAISAFSWPRPGVLDYERLIFLAPLFTSAWLWVYLIVAYAMRGINRFPAFLKLLSKVQDFEAHPVRTIGYVAATVSAIFVGIMTLT